VAVDLSSAYNVKGIYTDGSKFDTSASLDADGFAYSKEALRSTQLWDGVWFNLGPANAPDVVSSKTVALPPAEFASLKILATGVDGEQESQVFTVTYADGTSSIVTQSLSDWYAPGGYEGESEAVAMPYRLAGDGSKDSRTFHLYGYSFNLDRSKLLRSITLPDNGHVLVFAMTLVPLVGS
jgi:alpha-mannosidase